jgi:uncharacterized protein (TIGR02266 family)
MVLQVAWPEDPKQIADCSENLSRGGLFIQTDAVAALGQPVRLRLSFPDLLVPMEVEGVVAWVRSASESEPAGLGVRIQDKNPGYRAYLERLAAAAAGKRDGVPKRAQPYRMLIVDDNRFCLELYQGAIRDAEDLAPGQPRIIEVEVAVRGQQALQLLQKRSVDLVMTDLDMPGMNGFELIRAIRALPAQPGPRILVVSSFVSASDREKAVAAGADACLGKPTALVDLVKTVKALLSL